MKHTFRLIIILAALAFLSFVGYRFYSAAKPDKEKRDIIPSVIIESPQIQDVAYTLSFTGDVQPHRQVGIYSKIGGSLEALRAEVGDWVRQGELLARIDTSEISQQVLQTTATHQQVLTAFERAKELQAKELISQQDFDNAEAAYGVAKSAYESARLKLDYATITAPFSGVITQRFFDVGALINPNNAVLFTLVDIEVVRVIIDVLERDVPKITRGMEATVIVDAYPGETFKGNVRRLSESVDLNTRTMAVEVDVPNSDHRLKPGMFATVAITLDTHPNALTVPAKSLIKEGEGYFVWALAGDSTVKLQVTIGSTSGERIEVLGGLDPDNKLVVEGIQGIRQGAKVKIHQSKNDQQQKSN